MTPKRRIRRIQRWLTKADGWHPSVYQTHIKARRGVPVTALAHDKFIARLDRANRLFAAELTWLCEYAGPLATLEAKGPCTGKEFLALADRLRPEGGWFEPGFVEQMERESRGDDD